AAEPKRSASDIIVPFPLLIVPLLALKSVFLGRLVYRNRRRARADLQFRCSVKKGPGRTGQIHIPVGTRDLVVCYESGPPADFVVTRSKMKWVSGGPVEVTDEDLKLIRTTLNAWASARGSSVVGIDA
ncbi:MAG TPA: hypothetical protein VGD54_10290, partial [Steroidobacteraceae bacterium]